MKNFIFFSLFLLFSMSCQSQEERIVFSSNRYGNYDVFSMKVDGSDLKQLTTNKARDAWPKWSPDGTAVIFCSERLGKNQIFIMDADGKNQRNLSNNSFNELDPVISPDGKYIAFTTKATGTYQLHVMNIDGTGRKRLTNSGQFCGRPDWSPDARRLVYVSMENGFYEIYRINIDGSGKQKLTDFKTETSTPSWSKHGYYILFNAHENGVDHLYQMKPDGSELKKIKVGSQSDFMGRWSGNSDKLVFTSIRNKNYDLYTYDLNTKEEKQLSKTAFKESMADWYTPQAKENLPASLFPKLPKNYKLSYVSYRGGSADVFLSNPDGTAIQRLTETDDNNSFPKDAGNGKEIIFRKSDPNNSGIFNNYKLDLLSGQEFLYQSVPVVEGALEEQESPDGRHITYSKFIDDYYELFLYDKKTKEHRQITNHKKRQLPAQIRISFWSFDSKKIAYLSGKDYYNLYLKVFDIDSEKTTTVTQRGYMFSGLVWLKENDRFVINIKIRGKTTYELWAINLDGTGLRQLTDHPGRGSVHPAISPDGNWIAFETGRDLDDGEIYLMKPDGSKQTRITYSRSYEGRPAWIVVE